ncbi:MAG: hypothetical protein R3B93_20190 [Bacteroidia bacterium]
MDIWELQDLVPGCVFNFKPEVNFLDVAKMIMGMAQYFTDKDYLLPATFFEDNNLGLRFGIEPAFIQLPKYVSGNPPLVIGEKGQLFSTSLTAIITEALNTLKKPRLGRLVRLIPVEYRIGSHTLNFGPMEATAAWVVTTDVEFRDILAPGNAPANSVIQTELQAIPEEERSHLLEIIQFQSTNLPENDEDGAIALFLGKWAIENLIDLDLRLGLAQSESLGYGFGFYFAANLADFIDAKARGSVVIDLDGEGFPVVLDGHSHLQIGTHQIFSGDIQLNQDRFFLDGKLSLYPEYSPLQINGEGTAEIQSSGQFHFSSDVDFSLKDFDLLNAHVDISNDHIDLAGNWLGQKASFVGKKRNGELSFRGDVDFDFMFSLNVGPVYEPLTGIKIIDKIYLEETGLEASLDVRLDASGFRCEVSSRFAWKGHNFEVPKFILYVPPTSPVDILKAIIEQIKAHGPEILAQVFPTICAWLTAAANELVEFSQHVRHIAEAAKSWQKTMGGDLCLYLGDLGLAAWQAMLSWSKEAWEATKQWTLDAWKAVKDWTAAAWQATTSWMSAAWQATTQWAKEAWEATKTWTAAAWNATTNWMAEAWQATTQWVAEAWNATKAWTSQIWHATTEWVASVWQDTANWTAQVWQTSLNTIKTIVEKTLDTVNGVINTIQTTVNDITRTIQDHVIRLLNDINTLATNIRTYLQTTIRNAISEIDKVVGSIDKAVSDLESIVKSIQGKVNGLVGEIGGLVPSDAGW